LSRPTSSISARARCFTFFVQLIFLLIFAKISLIFELKAGFSDSSFLVLVRNDAHVGQSVSISRAFSSAMQRFRAAKAHALKWSIASKK